MVAELSGYITSSKGSKETAQMHEDLNNWNRKGETTDSEEKIKRGDKLSSDKKSK